MENLTIDEIVAKKQKRAKLISKLAPIIRWVFLGLSILCFYIAIRNSIGNLIEIFDKLDDSRFTGDELQANYTYLINKYGEWHIGKGGSGFSIVFINIKRAIFSGVMLTFFIGGIILLTSSFVFGKWLLPMLAKDMQEDAQSTTNVELLKMAERSKKVDNK